MNHNLLIRVRRHVADEKSVKVLQTGVMDSPIDVGGRPGMSRGRVGDTRAGMDRESWWDAALPEWNATAP